MRWEIWKPWYERIADKLKLDRRADEEAAEVLNDLLLEPDIEAFSRKIRGMDCVVLGAGPSLELDLERLQRFGYLNKVLISADGATSAVLKYRPPDIIATDLDGKVEDQMMAWGGGSWMVVHGHGDNIPELREVIPKLSERVIGTTQLKPFGKLYNFGGFTDGDRAAFMAHELGARRIYLAGMDLGDRVGKYSGEKDPRRKMLKLEICGELLSWLAGELGATVINLTRRGKSIKNVRMERLET